MSIRYNKINGIEQKSFRYINGLRKCCKYDGVNDIAMRTNITLANIGTIIGTGTATTLYIKLKFTSTGTTQRLFSSTSLSQAIPFFSFNIVHVDSNNFYFNFQFRNGSSVLATFRTANLLYSSDLLNV